MKIQLTMRYYFTSTKMALTFKIIIERKWRFLESRSQKEERHGEVSLTFSSTFPFRHFPIHDQKAEKLSRVFEAVGTKVRFKRRGLMKHPRFC